MAHVDRKEYWRIFVYLTVLTILEVGIVYIPMGNAAMILGLCGLAVVKAGLVGAFFMHLKHDTPFLQWTIAIPMGLPVFYAVVLCMDGIWRML